jgi:hypothetical protein
MTVITEVINSRGLDFDNQRKVVMCRSQRPPLAFKKIALLVRNRKGKKTTEDVVRRVFKRFNSKKGRVQLLQSQVREVRSSAMEDYEGCGHVLDQAVEEGTPPYHLHFHISASRSVQRSQGAAQQLFHSQVFVDPGIPLEAEMSEA